MTTESQGFSNDTLTSSIILHKCIRTLKQHPIIATCSVFTVTSGALLANWVINNINKAVAEQAPLRAQKSSDFNLSRGSTFNNDEIGSDSKLDDADKLEVRMPNNYNGLNPFVLRPLSFYEKFKIYFFCMNGIAHIRLTSFFLILSGMYIFSFPPKNVICSTIQRLLLRTHLFNCGFYWISGKFTNRPESSKSYRVIVANHNTFFDGLILLSMSYASVAAKKEISKIPILGRILKNGLSILWIDRHGPKGRENAKQQILDYVCVMCYVLEQFISFFGCPFVLCVVCGCCTLCSMS